MEGLVESWSRNARSGNHKENAPRTYKPISVTTTEKLEYAVQLKEVEENRPKTWGDCQDYSQFCPYVGCRYHLYLEVTPNGNIKINFPNKEVWEMEETCALSVADRFDDLTDTDISRLMNIVRQRVQQIRTKIQNTLEDLLDY